MAMFPLSVWCIICRRRNTSDDPCPPYHIMKSLEGTCSINLLLPSNWDSTQVRLHSWTSAKTWDAYGSWILSCCQLYLISFVKFGWIKTILWSMKYLFERRHLGTVSQISAHVYWVAEKTGCRDLTWSTLNLLWVWGKELDEFLFYLTGD